MTTTLRFPLPKDPEDSAVYLISFPEPVATVISAEAVQETPPLDAALTGWTTPGDTEDGSDLTLENPQVATDKLGVVMLLSGGRPRQTYAVRVGVTTVSGQTLYRSAMLMVTGL